MKHILLVCTMLALPVTTCGQQPGDNLHVATPSEQQPDPTGQRLQRLRQTAYALEQAGKLDQAASVRQQADQERQALMNRLAVLQAEVERIRQVVGASTQVVVQLQIAEVSLTKLQQLGFDLARFASDGDAKANTDGATFNAQWAAITKDGNKAQRLLESLRKDNLAKVLAEPTIVTVSGRTAVFNSGGKLSVPRPQPDGSVAVEDRYGTMLELTPEVLGEQVDLAIRGRLSELDRSQIVRVGKETLPGVQVREFGTRTKLKSGQILAISGPTQVRVETIAHGLPYVSDVPYVGALFRRMEEQRNDVAMLVLVRPEIVSSSVKAISPANASSHAEASATQPAPLNSPGYALPATARRPMKTR